MKRFYSKRQRLILSMVYGRVCKKCKSKVNDDFHVDHIKPCSSFNLEDPEEQKKCFHYKNLQPLWAKDNLAKGASVIDI